MFFLRVIFTAASVAAFFGSAQAAGSLPSAERQFEVIAQLPGERRLERIGQTFEVDIDLSAAGSLDIQVMGGRAEALYRMAFNQIAEGWSWQPLADPAEADYYRYKFLPLQSVAVDRGEYANEDKIGEVQQTRISWRYDYFLAFDNLYDFYPRRADDDAGFSASLPASLAGHLGLRARASLVEPLVSESTTFWKATHGKPTDFTLKKRYLVGHLEEVDFVDTDNGRVICRIRPGHDRCSAP